MKHSIIYKLYPQVAVIRGEDAFDLDGNQVDIDKSLIDLELSRTEYTRKREASYPSIQEQLDLQYWDKINNTNNWEQAINAVKNKYPKGNN